MNDDDSERFVPIFLAGGGAPMPDYVPLPRVFAWPTAPRTIENPWAKVHTRVCPNCGKSFRPKQNRQVACTTECVRAARKAAARMCLCRHCKKEFTAASRTQELCSVACAIEARAERFGQAQQARAVRA